MLANKSDKQYTWRNADLLKETKEDPNVLISFLLLW